MDESKEIGNDVEDTVDNNTLPAEFDGGDSSPAPSEQECHNLNENVKLQSEELHSKGVDNCIDYQGSPIDNQGSPDQETADGSIDTNVNMDADPTTYANVNMDANTKADADVSGAGVSTRDYASGNARILASDSDPDSDADANADTDMEADVDMEADLKVDASTSTCTNGKRDANAEAVADPSTNTDEELDVDASKHANANTNGKAKIDAHCSADGQHENSMSGGAILDPPVKSEVSHNETNAEENKRGEEVKNGLSGLELSPDKEIKVKVSKPDLDAQPIKSVKQSFLWEPHADEGSESGSEEDQAAFMKELETFYKERSMDFKPPKFYGEGLNLLKLWRAVTRLGGYEQVTSCKLWRQVGESFKPPKTCTTVSWTFRVFYEKALLEYEKHIMHGDELPLADASFEEPTSIQNQVSVNTTSGRARRDAAARAMQGWHSQRLLGNGEVGDPIIKDKNSSSTPKSDKQLKSIGFLKRKKPAVVNRADKAARVKVAEAHLDTMVVDIGPPADWVKVNVQRTKDCFEVYALVPGLLREEVRVQSDPVGRLVISGQPEQLDNPWGVTPFKKVVSLPSRIDPHQTSAVVTLHGQLFVRVPFEPSSDP